MPVHNFAEAAYRDKLFQLIDSGTAWLDVGCGRQLLPAWLKHSDGDQRRLSRTCNRLVGVDVVAADLARNPYVHEKVVAKVESMPFDADTFDLITARSVAEHLENPRGFLQEARRILKPGGRLLFATPNALFYQCMMARMLPMTAKTKIVTYLEGREAHDVFRTFYRFNTLGTIRTLATHATLEIESLETIECLPELARMGKTMVALENSITALLRSDWCRSFRAVIVGVMTKPALSRGVQRISLQESVSKIENPARMVGTA